MEFTLGIELLPVHPVLPVRRPENRPSVA